MKDDEHPYPISERKYDPVKRARAAKIASNIRWAFVDDRVAATQPMRDAQQQKFEDAVDPDRQLEPAERAKRVENYKSAYYTRLAQKSAESRRRRKEGP